MVKEELMIMASLSPNKKNIKFFTIEKGKKVRIDLFQRGGNVGWEEKNWVGKKLKRVM